MILSEVDISRLAVHVVIVALATLGNVEWLKNFIKPKHKRVYAVLGMIVLLVHVAMQMPCIPPVITTFWNLAVLGNAVMQFGHKALIKVPDAMINKAFGVKPDDAK